MEEMKNEDVNTWLKSELSECKQGWCYWRDRCEEMGRNYYVFIALSVGIGAVIGFAFGALTGGV